MTQDRLIQMLRSSGAAERRAPSFEGVDEAAALLERLSELSDSERARLLELSVHNRVVRDELTAIFKARVRRLRWIPIVASLAAAAVIVLAVIQFHTPQPEPLRITGWAFINVTSLDALGSKELAPTPDVASYEQRYGRLRGDLPNVQSPDVLEPATWAALSTRSIEDAQQFAQRWLELQPDAMPPVNALGLAALLRGDLPNAEAYFALADERAPGNADVLANRIAVGILLSRPNAELRAQLDRLRELAPQHRAISELARRLANRPS